MEATLLIEAPPQIVLHVLIIQCILLYKLHFSACTIQSITVKKYIHLEIVCEIIRVTLLQNTVQYLPTINDKCTMYSTSRS